MSKELPEEELDPGTGEGSSEARSPSEEQPGDLYRRLTESDSPAETPPFVEPEPEPDELPVIPHRHPTGTPGLTGGWMAESAAEQEELETEPSPASGQGAGSTGLTPPPLSEVLPARVPERDVSATRVGPAAYLPAWEANFGESTGSGGWGDCLLRMGILGVFAIAAIGIGLASFTLYQSRRERPSTQHTGPPSKSRQTRADGGT